MVDIERCKKCGAVIALVGRVHNCRQRPDAVSTAPTPPKPRPPKFGDAVNMPVSEMMARGINHANDVVASLKTKPLTEETFLAAAVEVKKQTPLKTKREPLAAQGAGPAPGKPARKKGTYTHRDPEKRKVYMRGLMKTRRAKEPA